MSSRMVEILQTVVLKGKMSVKKKVGNAGNQETNGREEKIESEDRD